jgi:hypothetical protein
MMLTAFKCKPAPDCREPNSGNGWLAPPTQIFEGSLLTIFPQWGFAAGRSARECKKITVRIKELQPAASNVQIVKAFGVDEKTIRNDSEFGDTKGKKINKGGSE